MQIPLKYPRNKFINANNITELKAKLEILMIIEFDIKNSQTKPFTDIINNVKSDSITKEEFELLLKENSIIIPTVIAQCES